MTNHTQPRAVGLADVLARFADALICQGELIEAARASDDLGRLQTKVDRYLAALARFGIDCPPIDLRQPVRETLQ